MKRFAIVIGLLALVALACGPASKSTSPEISQSQLKETTPQKGPGQQCEPGKEAWRSAGAPKRGGTLVRSATSIGHLDNSKPMTASGPGQGIPQVYQGLVELRSCYFEDLTMVPALAKSWQVSADGTTWTLKLQDQARWHNKPPLNGRAFTAADVAWTIDLQKNEGLLKPYWAGVEYQITDPMTIVLKTKEADADFLTKLGDFRNMIMPKEVFDQNGDYRTVAIGTGPFMVKEYKADQEYIMEPNSSYFEKGGDGKQLPYFDSVKTVVLSDAAAEIAALRSGQVDHTKFNGVEKNDADALRQSNAKVRIYEQLVFSTISVWMDATQKPFDNPQVRKAVQLAVNSEDMIGRYGGAAVRSGFVPAFLKDYAWPPEKLQAKFAQNLPEAKKLIEASGFRPGDDKITMKTATIFQQDAEVVAKQLEAIGIKTNIVVDAPNFAPVFSKGDFLIAVGSPGGVWFPTYWTSDLFQPSSAPRFLKINDAQLNSLGLAQAKEMDAAKRKQTLDQIQDRLYDLMPYVPMVSRLYYHVASCRLQNMRQVNSSYNPPMVKEAWIDASSC
ncbi:MAG: ABC transporter substrate-binding protein [Dehalococcoidia bacterium]|nr:ABC transporter substrate-binding protein [Dehalococcoidia bacterium]